MNLLRLTGFMTDAGLWSDVADRRAPVGPVTHGDLSRDATVRAMADRAIAGAPDRFGVVGVSMGRCAAREIARGAPGRVLVLIASSARADTPAQVQRKASAVGHVRPPGFSGLSRSAIRQPVHPQRAGGAALIERIRRRGDRLVGAASGRPGTCRPASPARR